MKYFYIEDDTGPLLGANGSALALSLTSMVGIIPDLKFPFPSFPIWAFFAGMVMAFLAKALIEIFNSDIRERERCQNMRDFVLEAKKDPALPQELLSQMEDIWTLANKNYSKLLSQRVAARLATARAYLYLFSAISFLLGVAQVIIFVTSKTSSL